MHKKQLLALTVISTVSVSYFFNKQINVFLRIDQDNTNFYWNIAAQILKYVVPTLIVLFIFHKPNKILTELGLKNDFLIGLKYAFFFTLPMLIGYYFMGEYNDEHPFLENVLRAFKDGFREEIYFRAFLFGQLFRQVKLGFIASVSINGLIFGFLHIYQAHSISESIGVFVITFVGAIWFAWLFLEWKENLWIVIFLHFFMNFYWHLFSTENSALGGLLLNLPRGLTIGISVYLTIKMIRKNGNPKINKTNLWFLKKTI